MYANDVEGFMALFNFTNSFWLYGLGLFWLVYVLDLFYNATSLLET